MKGTVGLTHEWLIDRFDLPSDATITAARVTPDGDVEIEFEYGAEPTQETRP